MAFPVVEGRNESTETGAVTTHDVTLPTGIQAGELLVVLLAGGGTNALQFNALAGWDELIDENVTFGLHAWYRWADGKEGATVTLTSTASSRSSATCYRISGASHPGIQVPQISAVATGSTNAPNPNSLSPTGGSKDYLWITCFALGSTESADTDAWLNNAATNYSNQLAKSSGTGGTNVAGMIASCERTNTAASEDAVWPAASLDASLAWRAFTIAIHPAPAATTTATARVSLAAASTPLSRTAHALRVRARVTSIAGRIRMALYEGSTNITDTGSGYVESGPLTTSLADYSLPIADANAAAISSYANLEVRFWGYANAGGSVVFEVDQVWLEIPAAAAGGPVETEGSGVSARVASGTDAELFVETGTGVSPRVSSGASQKVGGIVAVETGTGVSPRISSGADAATFVKAGSGVSPHVSSGTDAALFIESGSGVSPRVASGSSSKAGAAVEAGTGVSPHSGSASDAATFVETGTAVLVRVSSGADATVFVKAGSGVSPRVSSGSETKAGGADKAGTGVSTRAGSGANAAIFVKAGSGISLRTASGASARPGIGGIAEMPVISLGVPVAASGGTAADATDGNYNTFWTAAATAWLRVDIRTVADADKTSVLFDIRAFVQDNYYDPGTGNYGKPRNYTIDASAASSAPADGDGSWVNLVSVTDNPYAFRAHAVNLAGYNWVRFRCTSAYGGSPQCQIDLHDTKNGANDTLFGYGDSIMWQGLQDQRFDNADWDPPGPIQDAIKTYTGRTAAPLSHNGAVGGVNAQWGYDNRVNYIGSSPCKYVLLALGANDANNAGNWANKDAAEPQAWKADMQAIIDYAEGLGKIVVLPYVGAITAKDGNVQILNQLVDELWAANPSVVPGPDMYTLYHAQSQLLADGLHPSWSSGTYQGKTGYQWWHQLWAQSLAATIYAEGVAAETGSGVSQAVGSGVAAATFSEAGSGVSPRVGSGAATKGGTAAKAGSGVSLRSGSGSDAATFVEEATGASVRVSSGSDAATFAKAGAGVSQHVASGTWFKAGIQAKAGAGVSQRIGSGSDAATFAEAGSGVLQATSSGAGLRAGVSYVKTGSGVIVAVVSAARLRERYKAGSGLATAAGSGRDQLIAARSGSGVSLRSGSGSDAALFVERGLGLATLAGAGASQPVTYLAGKPVLGTHTHVRILASGSGRVRVVRGTAGIESDDGRTLVKLGEEA